MTTENKNPSFTDMIVIWLAKHMEGKSEAYKAFSIGWSLISVALLLRVGFFPCLIFVGLGFIALACFLHVED